VAEGTAQQVTQLLAASRDGGEDAAARLLELVYDELRSIASRQMVGVPPGDTLQPTALVHEAYLRLFGNGRIPWEDRAHFFYSAARAMRDIVIEQARKHASAKRGGGRQRVSLEEAIVSTREQATDLLALDEALQQLEATDATTSQVVMLRYFAGLTVPETAQAMGISPATVDRHWRYARAWLRRRVQGRTPGDATDTTDER
jgi:RNA polymerase sigma factor (TIGR02999 family)